MPNRYASISESWAVSCWFGYFSSMNAELSRRRNRVLRQWNVPMNLCSMDVVSRCWSLVGRGSLR